MTTPTHITTTCANCGHPVDAHVADQLKSVVDGTACAICLSCPAYVPNVDPETSADDEAFVTELATSLVVLIARWRERADVPTGAADNGRVAYIRAAAELEAVLRSAT